MQKVRSDAEFDKNGAGTSTRFPNLPDPNAVGPPGFSVGPPTNRLYFWPGDFLFAPSPLSATK